MKEIYIRKLSYIDAKNKLEREIQQAFVEGETYVEVIHGIGEGILKRMVIEYVQSQSYLKLVERTSLVSSNPGATQIEILTPKKEILKKYLKL